MSACTAVQVCVWDQLWHITPASSVVIAASANFQNNCCLLLLGLRLCTLSGKLACCNVQCVINCHLAVVPYFWLAHNAAAFGPLNTSRYNRLQLPGRLHHCVLLPAITCRLEDLEGPVDLDLKGGMLTLV